MLDPHLHYPKKKMYFQISICLKVQNNVTSITFHVESSFTLSKKIVLSNLIFAQIESAYFTVDIENMSNNQMQRIKREREREREHK